MARIPGELLIAFAAIAWGSAYPATTLVLKNLPPVGAAAWRGGLSAIVMIGILLARGEGRHLLIVRRQILPLVVLGGLGGTLFTIGLNLSVVAAGSSVTAFLVGSFPIVMVVTAPLVLRERLTPRVVAGAVLAVGGTLLLTRPGTGANGTVVVTALAASLGFALYLQLARKWGGPYALHPGTVAVVVMAAVPLGCIPLQLVLNPSGLVPGFTTGELIGFLWLATISGGIAHIAANSAVRRMPAGRSSAFLFLVPLSGATIAAIVLGERLDAIQIVGGLLIVTAIIVATAPRPRLGRAGPARA